MSSSGSGQTSSKTFLLALSGLYALLLLSSCASIRGPRAPKVFAIKGTDTQLLTEVLRYRDGTCAASKEPTCSDADSCLRKPSGVGCQVGRDTIIYDLKQVIDRNYEGYARSFEQTQDTSVFAGEVSAASLTAVATLVGASEIKDILTTASTLVQSTSTSVQKNFYQKQTGYSILSVMEADRAKQWATIYDKLVKNDATKYPLGEAMNELASYRHAGDAIHALTSIQQSAANNKQSANTSIANTDQKNGRATPAPANP